MPPDERCSRGNPAEDALLRERRAEQELAGAIAARRRELTEGEPKLSALAAALADEEGRAVQRGELSAGIARLEGELPRYEQLTLALSACKDAQRKLEESHRRAREAHVAAERLRGEQALAEAEAARLEEAPVEAEKLEAQLVGFGEREERLTALQKALEAANVLEHELASVQKELESDLDESRRASRRFDEMQEFLLREQAGLLARTPAARGTLSGLRLRTGHPAPAALTSGAPDQEELRAGPGPDGGGASKRGAYRRPRRRKTRGSHAVPKGAGSGRRRPAWPEAFARRTAPSAGTGGEDAFLYAAGNGKAARKAERRSHAAGTVPPGGGRGQGPIPEAF